MTFTPGGIALVFHEEVKPVAGLGDKVQILVSQNFYRHGDRYKDENGERSTSSSPTSSSSTPFTAARWWSPTRRPRGNGCRC